MKDVVVGSDDQADLVDIEEARQEHLLAKPGRAAAKESICLVSQTRKPMFVSHCFLKVIIEQVDVKGNDQKEGSGEIHMGFALSVK